MVAGGAYYWAATASGVTRIDPIPTPVSTAVVTGAPVNARLATGTDGVVHAAAKEGSAATWGV